MVVAVSAPRRGLARGPACRCRLPGPGGSGEGEGAAVEDVLAALSGDQGVERAEGPSLAGEDQDVGRGAFAQPVPSRQPDALAEAAGCPGVAAGQPVVEQGCLPSHKAPRLAVNSS